MTRKLLDQELQGLDAQMRGLGSMVEYALAQALEALEMGDQDKAGAVIEGDTAIDDLHKAIEERTFRTLTLQQPLAGHDLRYLASLVPIAIDLERIGDEAEAIARNVLHMMPSRSGEVSEAETPAHKIQEESSPSTSGGDQFSEASITRGVFELGQKVRSVLGETIQAFAMRDAEAARSLWEGDMAIDRDANAVRLDLLAMLEGAHAIPALQHDPSILQRTNDLLWIAHELERVADHCTNICERIVFIALGETDMHPMPEQKPGTSRS